MAFNTRDATPQIMSAEVRQWCQVAPPEDTRTLILSLLPHADAITIETGLHRLQAEILSTGPEVIIASIRCEVAIEVSHFVGIARIDMPSSYETKPHFPPGECKFDQSQE